jgi:Leishmanolysin
MMPFLNFTHDSLLPGIGESWSLRQRNGKCQYVGVHATTEFSKLAGCPTSIDLDVNVPTETDGGDGTSCGHWDEECLGNEVMTGTIPPPYQKAILSSITVGALHDLGYSVKYKAAEPFSRANVNPKCVCKLPVGAHTRRRRTVEEMDHGEVFPLLHGTGDADKTSVVHKDGPASSNRKVINDDMHALAMAEGRRLLQKAAMSYDKDICEDEDDDIEYVGDQMVTVFVMDGPHIFGVVVRNEQ